MILLHNINKMNQQLLQVPVQQVIQDDQDIERFAKLKKIVGHIKKSRQNNNTQEVSEEDEESIDDLSHTQRYELQVSDDSSDSETAMSLSPMIKTKLQERMNLNTSNLRKGYMDKINDTNLEQRKAQKNWKSIIRNDLAPPQNTSKTPTSTSPVQLPTGLQSRKTSSFQTGKQNLMYLRGLEQNKNLKDQAVIEEVLEQNKINIKLQTQDFFSFLRLQHEATELQRRLQDFEVLRQEHINLKSGDTIMEFQKRNLEQQKILEEKRFKRSWIVGISLAKRFLKKAQNSKANKIANSFVKTAGQKSPQKLSKRFSSQQEQLVNKRLETSENSSPAFVIQQT